MSFTSRKVAASALAEYGEVIIIAAGSSMQPMIYNKEAIYLKKVDHSLIRVGDAVFCKLKGGLVVHKVCGIDKKNGRFQIGNAANFINGWIGSDKVYGLCTQVEDRVIVSNEEMTRRSLEN